MADFSWTVSVAPYAVLLRLLIDGRVTGEEFEVVFLAAQERTTRFSTALAQGDVTVLQETAVPTNSVWAQVEYPALMANPNVTSITAVSPGTGGSIVLWMRA